MTRFLKKRALSWLLTIALVLSLSVIPLTAYAEAVDGQGEGYTADPDTGVQMLDEESGEDPDPDENPDPDDEEPGPEEEPDPEENESLSLQYDDRYSFTDLMGEGWAITAIQSEEPTSYQIVGGEKSDLKDAAVLTEVSGSGTDVIATGTGTALVTLENEDGETEDVSVTVDPAPLSLIFLTGQSNMEGMVVNNAFSDYENAQGSIVLCEEGQIYSTYAPTAYDNSSWIAYVNFSGLPSTITADQFVPESLTSDQSRAGNELDYKPNSLSASGQGKAGVDSGLAYEWNQLTGDKVWIVNTAVSATSITLWMPNTTYYDRSEAINEQALLTYQAEVDAGHYEKSSVLMFWLQGEADYSMSLEEYEGDFLSMYNGFSQSCGLDALGVISVRASSGSFTNAEDIVMTAPRIAQYSFGASSDYPGIYLVTNVNEQWVTDEGVVSYFKSAYPDGISYPTRSGESPEVPTCVSDIHPVIHYTQVGHNENGITAADGMYSALFGDESASGVAWRGSDGLVVSEVAGFSYIDSDIVVPSAQPVSLAKTVSYSIDSEDGGSADFDLMTATVSYKDPGTCYLVAAADDAEIARLEIRSSGEAAPGFVYSEDFNAWYYFDEKGDMVPSAVALDSSGKVYDTGEPTWWYIENSKVMISYTGFVEDGSDWVYVTEGRVTYQQNSVIEGTVNDTSGWWYVVGGKVQFSYTGVADYANEYGWWYIKDGMVDFSKNSVEPNSYGWWYVVSGQVDFSFTGLAQNDYGWWYISNGQVDFSKNSVIQGTVNGKFDRWYVTGGQVQFDYTGVADYAVDGVWWYIKNGTVDPTYTGLASNSFGTWYVSGGRVDSSFTGFRQVGNDWLYLENGQIRYDACSVLEGTVNGISGWWYVVDGKVQLDYTGVSNYGNDYGYWYIQNGRVDFSRNSVEQNDYGWWYVTGGQVDFGYTGVADYANDSGWWYVAGGKVDFTFTGIASNSYGDWYVEGGKVDFSKDGNVTFNGITWTISDGRAAFDTGFYQDGSDWYYYKDGQKQSGQNDILEGTVNGTAGWWYVVDGKVQFDYTGVSNHANAFGYWYIRDGKVDFSKNSVEQNAYGWWYVVGGQVDFSYTGVANYGNDYGWWYISGGQVDFSKNSVEQNAYGWWYVVGGQVDFSYTGVADHANDFGWWYISGGQVDFSKNSVEQNAYGWWYVSGGKVDFSKNSVEQNDYGWWYITGGKVDFSYTGVANYANAYGWWYISGGKVDFDYTGSASNSYGTWNVESGKVIF